MVQVFDLTRLIGPLDLLAKRVGQLTLIFDRFQNERLAFCQSGKSHHFLFDVSQLLFDKTAGLVFAIAGNERDCVARFEKANCRADFVSFQIKIFSNSSDVNVCSGGGFHKS